jgi:hypothetical protein
MKASKAVLFVDVQGDGTSVDKSAVYDHCMKQSEAFARGVYQDSRLQTDLGSAAITGPESNATVDLGGPGDIRKPGTIPGVTYP